MMNAKSPLGFVVGLLATGAAAGAAMTWSEARLDVPGLADSGTTMATGSFVDYGWGDGPFFYSQGGPSMDWTHGPKSVHTLMARPGPSTLTSRTETSTNPSPGFVNGVAMTGGRMASGETQTFTLTIADMGGLYDAEPQAYSATDGSSTVMLGLFHSDGVPNSAEGWLTVQCRWGGYTNPTRVSVDLQGLFRELGWDAAALQSEIAASLTNGHLSAPFTFPMVTITGAWVEFHLATVDELSPSPGALSLIPAALLLHGSRRVRRQ